MKDYKLVGSYYEVELDSGKVVKVGKKWVETSMENLREDLEDTLLMWLEDNDYLVNEDQQELDQMAKENKVKVKATTEKPKKKTQKERVVKENPDKELIISKIYEMLSNLQGIDNIIVENKAKLITFTYKNEDFKLDLVQKRKPKVK